MAAFGLASPSPTIFRSWELLWVRLVCCENPKASKPSYYSELSNRLAFAPMKRTILRSPLLLNLLLVICFSGPLMSQQANSTGLPKGWYGKWKGEVVSESFRGKQEPFQMELDVAATSDSGRLTWQIVYDGKQGRSQRDYELVTIDAGRGHYEVDEKNGIRITASLVGNALLSNFTVGGQNICTQYKLDEAAGVIEFELISANAEKALKTGTDQFEVLSLTPSNKQTAKLTRIESKPTSADSGMQDLAVWSKLDTEPYRGKQDDIFFVNEQIGWYANGAGKIFKTTDGGKSWQKQLDQPGTYFRCLAFLDENHGFAGNIGPGYFPNVTDNNPLYETKDGGQTWQPVKTIEGKPVVGLCAIQVLREQFVNAGKLDTRTRLIGVGRVGGPVAMITSDDSGATWQQTDISEHAAMAFDVHFFDRRIGFIAAATDANVAQSHALILHTQDGGATWKKVFESNRPFELTWKIAFPSRQIGYVTIQSYNPDSSVVDRFVAKTIDGGLTWQEIPLVQDAKVREFGVAFLNESIGWIGAMPHGFFTDDGGKSWRKADIGNAVNKIRLISNSDSTIGVAIGTGIFKIEIPLAK